MKYYIITGTSRGLGEAMARQLLAEGSTLFCISRNANNDLIDEAKAKGVKLHYFEKNLYDSYELAELMAVIFSRMSENPEGLYLINNAGVLDPIMPASKLMTADIVNNVNVNLIAPMILTSEFIKCGSRFSCAKRIMNISSGAGRNPYYGWSGYCASKSGLDMFTRTVALEEEGKDSPVEIVSMAPGIIDTGMQEKIRSADKEDFILLDDFIRYKVEGRLSKAEDTATAILGYLHSDGFESGGLTDVRKI